METEEGGCVCVHISDSIYYTAETDIASQNTYTPLKE